MIKNFCFPAYRRQSFMTHKAESHLATDRKVPRFEFKPCDGVSSLSKVKVVMSHSWVIAPWWFCVSPRKFNYLHKFIFKKLRVYNFWFNLFDN